MTQEEKKLLYKDLSARQPYRPFVCFAGKVTIPFLDVIASTESNELMSINGLSLEDVKPYLRPMSSMTEKEKEFIYNGHIEFWIREDYCNEHHLDYRGLIPMGLALEAPEDMYKFD